MKKHFIITLICLSLFNCSTDDPEVNNLKLSRIEIISSSNSRLDLGAVISLSVNTFDQFNDPISIDENVVWSANNDNVSLSQNGVVTGVAVGTTIITAKLKDLEDTYEVTIWDSSAPRTEIYVSDAARFSNGGPYKIFRYDENGNHGEAFISENLAWPQDVLFIEDRDEVLVSNFSSGNITKYDINTGTFISNFATGLDAPTRMKIGPDNLLYVLQWNGGGKVFRYKLDGTFVDDFTDFGVEQSIGMDWDSEGNLYVSSFNNGPNAKGYVSKFDKNGISQGKFIENNLQGPTNIWFNESGDLFALDYTRGTVKRFDSEGNFEGEVITGLAQPEGVAFFEDGKILIGNGGNGKVKLFEPNFNFIRDFVASSNSGGLRTPNAVVIRKVE